MCPQCADAQQSGGKNTHSAWDIWNNLKDNYACIRRNSTGFKGGRVFHKSVVDCVARLCRVAVVVGYVKMSYKQIYIIWVLVVFIKAPLTLSHCVTAQIVGLFIRHLVWRCGKYKHHTQRKQQYGHKQWPVGIFKPCSKAENCPQHTQRCGYAYGAVYLTQPCRGINHSQIVCEEKRKYSQKQTAYTVYQHRLLSDCIKYFF